MKFGIKSVAFLFFLIGFIACNNSSNQTIPKFTAHTIDGKLIQSDSLKGKIVVITIWATWCGNCLNELNSLNAVVENYKADSSVVFIAITDEPEEKVEHFLKLHAFNFQHIANAKSLKNLLHKSFMKEIPKTLVVNKNGEIVMDLVGELPDIKNILSSIIDKEKKQ
jgi:thiol-disulfide isomerase/thioredoxin